MQAPTSQPLLILGFESDAPLVEALARHLFDFGVASRLVDRRLDDAALANLLGPCELAIVVIAHPESVGADVIRLIDRIVAQRGRQHVVVAVPQGTFSGALLDLDRKKHIPLLDLGRRFDPGSDAAARLRRRVATSLIAAMPLDLPASLHRTAIQHHSIALLAQNLGLAASRPLHDWELVRLGDAGARPNPLWSSWLSATASAELARLGTHLDELRVHELLGDEREAKA